MTTAIPRNYDMDAAWTMLSAMQVFFMQIGFVMLEVGTVQSKSAINIVFKNYMDTCLGGLVWWMVGYGVANAGGGRRYFFDGESEPGSFTGWFFSYTFAATAATIVSGAVAERTKIAAYFVYTVSVTSIIYPLVALSLIHI